MRRNKLSSKRIIQKEIQYREKNPIISGRNKSRVIKKENVVIPENKVKPEKTIKDNAMEDRTKRRLGVNVELVNTNSTHSKIIANLIPVEQREPISIIVTAYQTQNYIEECLNSIENQTYFKDFNNYEILVGVDGCEKTLNKLLEIRHKYRNLRIFMMEKNMGTFITTNTLLDLIKYDKILRFDSDDIMLPFMVNEIMVLSNNYSVIRFKYCNFSGSIKNSINTKRYYTNGYANGTIFYQKKILNNIGGYRSWLCAADGDLLNRVEMIIKIHMLDKLLFYRRVHNKSLTKNKETGMNSSIRKIYHKIIKENTLNKIYIKKECNEYYEI